MKKSRFTESQIVAILKQHEAGVTVADLCREHGITNATFYNWKAKYGGMDASQLKRIRELEEENSKLKRMYAELSLVHHALKDAIEKKSYKPERRREVACHMIQEHGVSIRQACKAVELPRTTLMYKRKPKDDDMIIEQLTKLTEQHPSIGFWMCYHRLRRMGHPWNHKRIYRVYTALKLNIRRRARKRLPARVKQALFQPQHPNQVWSLDFMSDSLWDGRTYRLLNVMDDYNRQVLAVEADTSLPALRVIRILEQLKECRGLPQMIRVDNGPEFISFKLDHWCKENKITLTFIQPGKPMQNGYIERCNGSIRSELLNAYVFKSLNEVRQKADEWMTDYNHHRPHKALNYQTPADLL
ncbi:MAG TPA: IS3 family transposase [Patescibacteria group bacterium]|nr:IS3 family transposase [Patescibacteria group bacterium]